MIKALRSTAVIAALILLAVASTGCGGKKANMQPAPMAKVACDESFENIMEQEINVYEYIYPKEDVLAYYLPENACIDSIMAMGSVKAAVVSRPLTEQEVSYLRSNKKVVHQKKIAVDALAIIVNLANPVEIMSRKDIAEILSGDVTRWDQVEKTNPEVFKAVAENKNAMGVIGVSWVSSDMRGQEKSVEELAQAVEKSDTTQLDFNADVKVLKIRGNDVVAAYKPYQAYIFDGSYPLYRSVYMISTAPGGTIAHRFYSFVTGFQGQKLIQMTGILPATVRPRMVQVE